MALCMPALSPIANSTFHIESSEAAYRGILSFAAE